MTTKNSRKAKIISVTSGKGGVGKSLFSVNFSIACAKLGKKVLLIDGDLGLANVHILTNAHPEYDLLDILEKRKPIEETIIQGPEGVHIIPGASGIFKLSNLTHARRQMLVNEFAKLESLYDIILIDTEAGISHNVIKFISISDETFVVCTPDITSMADAYATIKVIRSKKMDTKLSIIINRIKSYDEAHSTYKKLSTVCDKFLSIVPANLGYIFEDAHIIKQSVKKRVPYIISYPKSKVAISLKTVTSNYFGLTGTQTDSSNFLNKLAMLIPNAVTKKEEVAVTH